MGEDDRCSDRLPADEVIHHQPVLVRRKRSLDEELLDWLTAAPAELDSESWERMLAIAQRAVRGPTILELANQLRAGVR